MDTICVVVGDVVAEESAKVVLAQDNHVIDEFESRKKKAPFRYPR